MGRRPIFTLIWAVSVLACGAATNAQCAETVLAGGASSGCFEAAKLNASARDGVASCTAAIESGTLSVADHAATLIDRGILKMRLHDLQGALGDFDAGLALRPDLAEAYVDRGALLLQVKRYDDALADLNKSIALKTEDANVAYFNRGLARERTGDFADACADYRQALALQPDFLPAKNQLVGCPSSSPAKSN
jgi:tetratricopeptide (TPR) repeat protein